VEISRMLLKEPSINFGSPHWIMKCCPEACSGGAIFLWLAGRGPMAEDRISLECN